ncbi:MAG: hypothetical protein KC592_20000 [Nitrospira sp.]|nr:hypothetical protein [Nitrospira sp.]
MRWRKISEAEVNDTLTDPDKIEESTKGRKTLSKISVINGLRLHSRKRMGPKLLSPSSINMNRSTP